MPCAWRGQKRVLEALELELRWLWSALGWWHSNLGPREEQSAVFHTEASLQPCLFLSFFSFAILLSRWKPLGRGLFWCCYYYREIRNIILNSLPGWGDASVCKITGCSARGSRFESHRPNGFIFTPSLWPNPTCRQTDLNASTHLILGIRPNRKKVWWTDTQQIYKGAKMTKGEGKDLQGVATIPLYSVLSVFNAGGKKIGKA